MILSDAKVIQDELVNILVAGRDTVSILSIIDIALIPFIDCFSLDVCYVYDVRTSENGTALAGRNFGKARYETTYICRHPRYEIPPGVSEWCVHGFFECNRARYSIVLKRP